MKQFTPRIRFNWGFWDARLDREMKQQRRYPMPKDTAYCQGYEAGKYSDMAETTSTKAWQERRGAQ